MFSNACLSVIRKIAYLVFVISFLPGWLLADNYRWTGTGGDGLWETAENWEVEDSDNPGVWNPAVDAPGSGAVVTLGNAAADQAQTITLTGNVQVAQVIMAGLGNRSYTLNGDGYSITTTSSSFITRTADATADMVFAVPVVYATASGLTLSNLSGSGRIVLNGLEMNAPNWTNEAMEITITGSGLIEFREPLNWVTGKPNSRLNIANNNRILFNPSSADSMMNRPLVVNSGSVETHGTLYFANNFYSGSRLWLLPFGSTVGAVTMQLMEAEDRDVVVSFSTIDGFGNNAVDSPTYIFVRAPADDSTGTLTLQARSDLTTAGTTGYRSVAIHLDANTFFDLGRNQASPNAIDVAGGIHGEGALIRTQSTHAVSQIGDKNTYTGGTFIEVGTMRLIGAEILLTRGGEETEFYAGELGPGLLHVAAGATFDINNLSQTLTGLRNSEETGTGGTVSLGTGGSGSLTINGSEDSLFGGSLTGKGTVTKTGTGTQTFTGSVNFEGNLNINGGKINANGTVSNLVTVNVGDGGALCGTGTVNSVVYIGSGGTLSGTGTYTNTTTIAGTLAPGHSPGEITFTGDLIFGSGAVIHFELGDSGSDLIVLSGSDQVLQTSGLLFWHFMGDGIVQGTPYLLIDWSGATGLETFDFLLSDLVIANSGWEGGFLFDPENGLYVTFGVVPEPRLAALGCGLVAVCVMFLRRRRQTKA